MYDVERVGKIILDIEKYKKELDGYAIGSDKELYESKNYRACSMVVFGILNRTIDLATEIISAEELGAPNSFRDIMPIIAKANIINKNKADVLGNLLKKRNIFAHFYEDMSEKELYKTIKEIPEVIDFVNIIKKRISNRMKEKDLK